MDALGSDVRRSILSLLANGPKSVAEIAKAFPISRPAVSKHLRVLQSAGLITCEARGTRNYYCLATEGFMDARRWLDQFWSEALRRLKIVAENLPEGDEDA